MGFRTERLRAGMKPKEVAQALGVTDVSVYFWEIGKTYPTAEKLKTLAKLYGCTVDKLLEEEETHAQNQISD